MPEFWLHSNNTTWLEGSWADGFIRTGSWLILFLLESKTQITHVLSVISSSLKPPEVSFLQRKETETMVSNASLPRQRRFRKTNIFSLYPHLCLLPETLSLYFNTHRCAWLFVSRYISFFECTFPDTMNKGRQADVRRQILLYGWIMLQYNSNGSLWFKKENWHFWQCIFSFRRIEWI